MTKPSTKTMRQTKEQNIHFLQFCDYWMPYVRKDMERSYTYYHNKFENGTGFDGAAIYDVLCDVVDDKGTHMLDDLLKNGASTGINGKDLAHEINTTFRFLMADRVYY